jgi:flagellar biosynthetic protein FliR
MIDGFFAEMSNQIWLVAATFLRIGPAFYLAPGFGERYVSVRVRLSVAGMFAVAIAPVLAPHVPATVPAGAELLKFGLLETTIGVFIGLMSRGIIYLLEKGSLRDLCGLIGNGGAKLGHGSGGIVSLRAE